MVGLGIRVGVCEGSGEGDALETGGTASVCTGLGKGVGGGMSSSVGVSAWISCSVLSTGCVALIVPGEHANSQSNDAVITQIMERRVEFNELQ
jgi:hypothetical protein